MFKKIFTLMLAGLLVISLLPFGVAAEEAAEEEVIVYYSDLNYDSGTIKASDYYSYQTANYGNNGHGISVVADGDSGNYVLKFDHKADSVLGAGKSVKLCLPAAPQNATAIGGKLVYEYDFKLESISGNFSLFELEADRYVSNGVDEEGNPKTKLQGLTFVGPTIETTGKIYVYGYNGNAALHDNLEKNVWYNIKCVVDIENAECVYYLDDEPIYTRTFEFIREKGFFFKFTMLTKIINFSSSVSNTIYFDNVKLYNVPAKYNFLTYKVINDVQSEGLDAFPLSGGVAKITFSQKMIIPKKEDFTFTVDGMPVDFDFSYKADENSAYLTPKTVFKGRENCKISFDKIKSNYGTGANGNSFVEFVASPPVYGISAVELPELVPDTTANIKVSVQNHTDKDETGMVLVGIYKDGKLMSFSTAVAEIPVNLESDNDIPMTISVPASYNSDDYDVFVYLMNKDTFFSVDFVVE